MRRHAALRAPGVQLLRAARQHLVAHHAHERDQRVELVGAGEEAVDELHQHGLATLHRVALVHLVGHELPVEVIERRIVLHQAIEFIEGGGRVAPGDARRDAAADLVARLAQVLEHLAVDAAAPVAVGRGLATVDGDEHVRELGQHPVGQVVEQRAIGLQLVAPVRKALHHLDHHGTVQCGLAAVEGDVDLLAGQVPLGEGDELLHAVFDVDLRAEHIAHAQRAVAALEVALERGEQLQLDAVAHDGVGGAGIGHGGGGVAGIELEWDVHGGAWKNGFWNAPARPANRPDPQAATARRAMRARAPG